VAVAETANVTKFSVMGALLIRMLLLKGKGLACMVYSPIQ